MASVAVSELRKKLMLLVELGAFPSLKALAEGLKRSESTVLGWSTDRRDRSIDSVPARAFEALLDLYSPLLPDLPRSLLQSYVQGPSSQLASALRKDATESLMKVIKDEAIRAGRLLIWKSQVSLVEVEDDLDCDSHPIKIGIRFRIEYPARHDCRHALVVQHAGASWGVLRPTLRKGVVDVPGMRSSGELKYMAERVQRGPHRFVCFQIAQPFPARILSYADERTALDKQGLELLAAFYSSQPEQQRLCQMLAVTIGGDGA